VKVPHGMYASGNGAWSRFQREEEFGCKLSHPYILRFFVPVARKNRGAYIVTEYLRGQTLEDRLAAPYAVDGKRRPFKSPVAFVKQCNTCNEQCVSPL